MNIETCYSLSVLCLRHVHPTGHDGHEELFLLIKSILLLVLLAKLALEETESQHPLVLDEIDMSSLSLKTTLLLVLSRAGG